PQPSSTPRFRLSGRAYKPALRLHRAPSLQFRRYSRGPARPPTRRGSSLPSASCQPAQTTPSTRSTGGGRRAPRLTRTRLRRPPIQELSRGVGSCGRVGEAALLAVGGGGVVVVGGRGRGNLDELGCERHRARERD